MFGIDEYQNMKLVKYKLGNTSAFIRFYVGPQPTVKII